MAESPPRPLTPESEDPALDQSLRPRGFHEFVGQRRVVDNLAVYLQAAKARSEAIDHVLLSGPPGLGKTTLAHLIARDLGVNLRITSGPVIERPYDLVGLLTSLEHRDVLFIDEIHRLPRAVEEYLYSAMEDYRIDIVIDQGPAARSVPIDLRRFTLIGATTREGLLSAPMRSRFGVLERLDFYPPEELVEILRRSSSLLGVAVDDPALHAMAGRSRGTPRVANRFLRRIRDLAQVKGAGTITAPLADEGLAMLGVDEHGLTPLDREILRCLQRLGGGPVGLKTVAISVGEEERTLEDVYEPFLIRQGLLLRTPRGRKLTLEGRKLLRPGARDGLFA